MDPSDRLRTEWLEKIAQNGNCYQHEAQKMAREILALRKKLNEYPEHHNGYH